MTTDFRECSFCHNPFVVKYKSNKKYKALFCSVSCFNHSRKRLTTNDKSAYHKKYYYEHKLKILERCRKWYSDHREIIISRRIRIPRKATFLGKHHSEETKKKISLANKGKKSVSYWTGKKMSDNHRLKLSISAKRRGLHPNFVSALKRSIMENPSHGMRGKTHRIESKILLSHKLKGRIPFMKGKKHSESTKEKMRLKILCGNRFGDNSPNWKGGISFEPYPPCFNNKIKRFIKKRDQICVICSVALNELKAINRVTNIHHIDYDKSNNLPQNLVALCNVCHPKTGANRESWKLFFQNMLSEKYNYKYVDGKILIELAGVVHE